MSGHGIGRLGGRGVRAEIRSTNSERTERIVDAAVRCFSRWGVEGTRMQDIADTVGIPRPHLYRHFPSKDALIIEVVLREIRITSERLARNLRLAGPARHALVKAVANVIEEGRNDYYVKLLLRSDVIHTTARVVADTDAVVDAMAEYFRPVLDYARKRGELRDDIDLTTTVRWLSFLILGYLTLPEMTGSRRELRAQLETYVAPGLFRSP
jgi:AcrR family transcriptional regulator